MSNRSQQGSAPLYIALVLTFLIVSSAIVLTGALSVQLRFTRNLISSEQAFYAANSGVEEALYMLAQQNAAGEIGDVTIEDGEIEYGPGDTARYEVQAKTVIEGQRARVCVSSLGTHSGDQRRLQLGPSVCDEG